MNPSETQSVKKRRCPVCGRGQLEHRLITHQFEYTVDDKPITVEAQRVPVEVCNSCNETFFGPDAARIEHDAACRTLELLTPDQIRAIRESLGTTQEEFAELTGIGQATISRWERGRLLQNRSHDRYLRLLAENADNVRLLKEQNKPDSGRKSTEDPVSEDDIVVFAHHGKSPEDKPLVLRLSCKLDSTDRTTADWLRQHRIVIRKLMSAAVAFSAQASETGVVDSVTDYLRSYLLEAGATDHPRWFVRFLGPSEPGRSRFASQLSSFAEALEAIPDLEKRLDLVAECKRLAHLYSKR